MKAYLLLNNNRWIYSSIGVDLEGKGFEILVGKIPNHEQCPNTFDTMLQSLM